MSAIEYLTPADLNDAERAGLAAFRVKSKLRYYPGAAQPKLEYVVEHEERSSSDQLVWETVMASGVMGVSVMWFNTMAHAVHYVCERVRSETAEAQRLAEMLKRDNVVVWEGKTLSAPQKKPIGTGVLIISDEEPYRAPGEGGMPYCNNPDCTIC